MKRFLSLTALLSYTFLLCAQGNVGIGTTTPQEKLSVDGKVQITDMDTANSEELLVVRQNSGTLAVRQLSSIMSGSGGGDSTRSLTSDLFLTSLLCDCTSIPPALVQSLLDHGYSVADLLGFGVAAGDLLAAGVSVAELLDATGPLQLVEAGLPLDSLYGKFFAGGLIFYVDVLDSFPEFEGLVAAPEDQAIATDFTHPWGCPTTDLPIPNVILSGFGIGGAIGSGLPNTLGIDTASCSGPGDAAVVTTSLSLNGFSDWHLPSQQELGAMYFEIGPGGDNSGGFIGANYWSSTERQLDRSWVTSFVSGVPTSPLKTTEARVRAIRRF